MQLPFLNPGCYTVPLGSDLLWWLSEYLCNQDLAEKLVILPTQRTAGRLKRLIFSKKPELSDLTTILSYDQLKDNSLHDNLATKLIWELSAAPEVCKDIFKTMHPTYQQRKEFSASFAKAVEDLYAYEILPESFLEKIENYDLSSQTFYELLQKYETLKDTHKALHPIQSLVQGFKAFHTKISTFNSSVYFLIDGPIPPSLQKAVAELCKKNYVFVYGAVSSSIISGYDPYNCYVYLHQTLHNYGIKPEPLKLYVPRQPLIQQLQKAVFDRKNLSAYFEGIYFHEEQNILSLSHHIIDLVQTLFKQGKRIVTIATPNRQLAKLIRMCSNHANIQVDDSCGIHLSETSLGYLAIHMTQWLYHPKDYKQLLNLISHPLLSHYWQDLPFKLDAWGRSQQISLSQAVLSYTCDTEHENARISELKKLLERSPVSSYADCITTTLGYLQTWNIQLENELISKHVMDVIQSCNDTETLEFMLQTLTHRIPTPKGPHIQIIGPLEARLIQPETIILADMNEGEWPLPSSSSPWIYPHLRNSLGLPKHDEIIGLSSKIFLALLGCKHVYLCRTTHKDGHPTNSSRWWKRLNAIAQLNDTNTLSPATNKIEDRKLSSPSFKIPPNLIPKRLSISQLHLLINDPSQFLLQHIFNLEDLLPWDIPSDHRDKGIIVHTILEKAITQGLSLDNMFQLAHKQIGSLNIPPSARIFWEEDIIRNLSNFHSLHTSRKDVLSTWAEVKGEWIINTQFGPISIIGKADRIDQLSDGSFHIIDYKTGTLSSKQSVYQGLSPQLPILGFMLKNGAFKLLPSIPPFMVSYWSLKEPETQHFIFEELLHLEQQFIQVIEKLLNPETIYELNF